MNTETAIKEQETMDQEKSINDFFIEEVEKVNERLKKEKEGLKLMTGFICHSELPYMDVSRNRSIRDNIKNAMAIANNNIMASIYTQTETEKYRIELEKTRKKYQELENKINSQPDVSSQLKELNDDMYRIETLLGILRDLSISYADCILLDTELKKTEAFNGIKELADIVLEQIKDIRDQIDNIDN